MIRYVGGPRFCAATLWDIPNDSRAEARPSDEAL
jgi:hypothetical protein